MIDVASAYGRLASLLAERGLGSRSYCITLHAWNHRHGQPAVTFDVSIHMSSHDVLFVGSRSTLDGAVDELMFKLDERLRPKDVGTPATLSDLGEVRT